MSKSTILKVAVNVPLSRSFDYLPPEGEPLPGAGCRVLAPFGRRRQVGLVLEHADESAIHPDKVRPALECLDTRPLLSDADLWLIRFTADYYHHPIGEVVAAALPALLRQGKALHPVTQNVVITDAGDRADVEAMARRAHRQAELLQLLSDAGGNGLDVDTLNDLMPGWRRAAAALHAKGLVERIESRAADFDETIPEASVPGPSLNSDQHDALATLRRGDGYSTCLIDGVTGSGKTEVYLSRMSDVLERGDQVLVLVPEIGLTPQLVARLRVRLGLEPALLHSGLTDLARLTAWRAARSGAARLVVGTRSAVFAPLARPGMIVVDEEHDQSFKQQEGLRYSARDLAIARAKHLNIPIVLGSATPSLEVLARCRSGSYRRVELPSRAGGAAPPRLTIVDTSRKPATGGLSQALTDAIKSHLAADGQVLLFLNRRGFAPTLICAGCGHIAECRRCDSRMTVHVGQAQLRCHHCGASRPLDTCCAECGSSVTPLGEGTERIEDTLRARFPDYDVTRIDSDTTQRKGAMDEALAKATAGKANILVGTQMLSKGHHFPNLTLVGIVNADQGLFGTDFRSSEKLAQSIVQVSGRAGRERRAGEVLIQTAYPEHPFWSTLIDGGYSRIANDILAEREQTRWPPYTRLALLRSAATRRADALALLDAAHALIAGMQLMSTRLLGPVDAPMARRAGRYRSQLLLQSGNRQELHDALRRLRPVLEEHPAARRARWSIDVDPIELF